MSRNNWLAIAVGTTGIFLAYCFYFDRKRRCQSDYKKKVHIRRQQYLKKNYLPSSNGDTQHILLEPSYHNVLEKCFFAEIRLGELLISFGKVSEGLGHLANAIMTCAQPKSVLQTLKVTLPELLFKPLMLKLQELQELPLAYARQTTSSFFIDSPSSWRDVNKMRLPRREQRK